MVESTPLEYEAMHLDELKSSTNNGRLIRIDSERMSKLMETATELLGGRGAYGITYKCQLHVNKETQDMIIKKICCNDGDKDDNRRSAIKEMLASRLKHHHIVPILAFSEDTKNKIFYFVMPYMENGDLQTAILKDTKLILRKEKAILTKAIRLKILLQLAVVLEFLHQRIDGFRESYVHGDISSRNIVLDGQFNMRLLDFGVSKEEKGKTDGTTTKSSNMPGTDGYYPLHCPVVSKRDCYSWAAIALELLTGQLAAGSDGKLMEEHDILENNAFNVKNFWKVEGAVKKDETVQCIMNLVEKCKKFKLSAKEIAEQLKEQMRLASFDKYKTIPNNIKCMVCMVGKKVKGDVLDHRCGDDYGVDVCVSCLRNSYLNPIKCPCCLEDLFSPIGVTWGAVLIAGNAVGDEKLARAFKKDVDIVYKTITSKRQLSMGIRTDRVKKVYMKTPGTRGTLIEELQMAFSKLCSEGIDTLLLYFTGHADKQRFILGSPDETVSEKDLNDMLKDLFGVKKLIMFLDCCYPGQSVSYEAPNDLQDILKLTACSPTRNAGGPAGAYDETGSVFTNLLVQCLSGNVGGKCFKEKDCMSACKVCADEDLSIKCRDGFISFEFVFEYIGRHMPNQYPKQYVTTASWIATKLAYYNSPAAFEFEFDCDIRLSLEHLPETNDELMNQLHRLLKAKLGDGDIRCKHFKDVYAVAVITGSEARHQQEQITLANIESAWNGQSILHLVPRNIRNIDNGKVGVFLSEGIKPKTIFTIISMYWKSIEQGISGSIPLKDLNKFQDCCFQDSQDEDHGDLFAGLQYLQAEILNFMVKGYKTKKQKKAHLAVSVGQCKALQKCSEHQNKQLKYYCEQDQTRICKICFCKGKHIGHRITEMKDRIEADEQLSKEKTGNLVFTFSLDENGEYEKFFSVQIKDDNLAENRNNELTGQAEADDSEMQGASNF